jgi:hypothetical protein
MSLPSSNQAPDRLPPAAFPVLLSQMLSGQHLVACCNRDNSNYGQARERNEEKSKGVTSGGHFAEAPSKESNLKSNKLLT